MKTKDKQFIMEHIETDVPALYHEFDCEKITQKYISLEELSMIIEKMKKLKSSHICLEFFPDYSDEVGTLTVNFVQQRIETDEEYKHRIIISENLENIEKLKRKMKYLELKKEFDND